MRSLGHGIGAGLLSSGWLALLSLVLAPVYVHLLGIESYGLIGLYTAALAIGGILDVALSATVSREIAWKQARVAEQHEVAPLLCSVEIIYWIAVSALALILLGAGALFGSGWLQNAALPDHQVKGALALMLLSLAIQLPSGLYTASLIGLHRQARSAGLVAGFGTVRGLGAALIVWSVSSDIRAFFLWHVVVGLAQILCLRWQTWTHVRALGGESRFTAASLVAIKHAVGAMFLITVLGVMLSQIDKVFLVFLVPLDSIGYYTLAWGLASGLTIIATPVVQGFAVRFSALASAEKQGELEAQINMASHLAYALVIPPAAMLALFPESILLAWVRNMDVAAAAAAPLSFLALGTAMVACTYPLLAALYAKKEFKQALLIQLACLLLFFPVMLWLTASYGIRGAALCWCIYGIALFLSHFTLTFIRHRREVSHGLLKDFSYIFAISTIFGLLLKQLLGQFSLHHHAVWMVGVTLICTWGILLSVSSNLRLVFEETIKYYSRRV